MKRFESTDHWHRVEELLNDFIAGTVAYAAAEKLRRDERWQREWADKEMRRVEEQQGIERDKKRWEFLEDRIGALERAQKIDRFLEHLASGSSESEPPGQRMNELMKWVQQYTGHLRDACTASEIDRVLKDVKLFELHTEALSGS